MSPSPCYTGPCRKSKQISNLTTVNARAEGYKGNKGFKRARKAEQIFVCVELKRENAKGGIDWWTYRDEVLITRLIPYYEALQRLHSGKVYVVEDGVGLHNKG
jgi:hypothetical protein